MIWCQKIYLAAWTLRNICLWDIWRVLNIHQRSSDAETQVLTSFHVIPFLSQKNHCHLELLANFSFCHPLKKKIEIWRLTSPHLCRETLFNHSVKCFILHARNLALVTRNAAFLYWMVQMVLSGKPYFRRKALKGDYQILWNISKC